MKLAYWEFDHCAFGPKYSNAYLVSISTIFSADIIRGAHIIRGISYNFVKIRVADIDGGFTVIGRNENVIF